MTNTTNTNTNTTNTNTNTTNTNTNTTNTNTNTTNTNTVYGVDKAGRHFCDVTTNLGDEKRTVRNFYRSSDYVSAMCDLLRI